MKKAKNDFFWPSFTDLMMSLFFIMLVLYVLTYVFLKNEQKATAEQLRRIREIQHAASALDKKYFTYDSTYKRFTLNRQISFAKKQSTITDPKDRQYLLSVGMNIQRLILNLQQKYRGQNISYMVIIEGMASRDSYDYNYQLSYERALALYKLWQDAGIRLNSSTCELQIAGSGTAGVGRSRNEALNQRFLIQVIPKIGTLQ